MDLPKTAKQIEDSRDYVDVDGSVWAENSGKWYKKVQKNRYGYQCCDIYRISLGRTVSMRVHNLVARTFILNDCPDCKVYVAHRNNIKTDNRAENLYWTAPSEAVERTDDLSLVPVNQYSTHTNKLLAEYNSVTEAAQETGIPENTIWRQCKYHRPVRKETYFRFVGDESTIESKYKCESTIEIQAESRVAKAKERTPL